MSKVIADVLGKATSGGSNAVSFADEHRLPEVAEIGIMPASDCGPPESAFGLGFIGVHRGNQLTLLLPVEGGSRAAGYSFSDRADQAMHPCPVDRVT